MRFTADQFNNGHVSSCRPTGVRAATAMVALILSFLEFGVPWSAFPASYFPVPLYHRQEKLETSMRAGETVYLFHSGTRDVRAGIHPHDVLTVHRINSSCQAREVGK